MKKILGIALLLISCVANAIPQDLSDSMQTMIIKPSVATNVRHYYLDYSDTTDQGITVVCPDGQWHTKNTRTCVDQNNRSQWKTIPQLVPPGKTYVGFIIDTRGNIIYVFWK